MIALIVAVFLASLLGSLHCAGMCGGLMALAIGLGDGESSGGQRRIWLLHSGYHGGRLVTYSMLGAGAGAMGAALDLGGGLVGMQRIAVVVAGVIIIGFGVCALLNIAGARIPKLPLPGALQKGLVRAHRSAFGLPPVARAVVIGLLTTLLPCGWLWAFAITAAGTASPALGALTMAVFWVGTLPVLVSLGTGIHLLMGRFGRRMPVVAASALVVVGVLTVSERLLISPVALAAALQHDQTHSAVDRVRQLDSSAMPCCSTAQPICAEEPHEP